MEAVVTSRMDARIKDRGSAVMRREGLTPSQAVRQLFEYVARHDKLPFSTKPSLSQEEVRRRIARFDACHTKQPLTSTDDELRDQRLRDRYGLTA